jgi:hypothetical protein
MTFISGFLELNKIAIDKTNMFTIQLILSNEAIIFAHYRYVKDLSSKYNYIKILNIKFKRNYNGSI